MIFKFSDHAMKGHEHDKWNARTILQAYQNSQLRNVEVLHGQTADIIIATAPDGRTVGLVVGKPRGNVVVIITGFAAGEDYWRSV